MEISQNYNGIKKTESTLDVEQFETLYIFQNYFVFTDLKDALDSFEHATELKHVTLPHIEDYLKIRWVLVKIRKEDADIYCVFTACLSFSTYCCNSL